MHLCNGKQTEDGQRQHELTLEGCFDQFENAELRGINNKENYKTRSSSTMGEGKKSCISFLGNMG